MRFGVRSKAVEKLEDVKTGLITVRRIVFTPSVEVKDELKNTSIQITCLNEEGNVLKRITSATAERSKTTRMVVLRTRMAKVRMVVQRTTVLRVRTAVLNRARTNQNRFRLLRSAEPPHSLLNFNLICND